MCRSRKRKVLYRDMSQLFTPGPLMKFREVVANVPMTGSANDKVFAGSIPAIYEKYLVPLIFEPYARDLAARPAARPPDG